MISMFYVLFVEFKTLDSSVRQSIVQGLLEIMKKVMYEDISFLQEYTSTNFIFETMASKL